MLSSEQLGYNPEREKNETRQLLRAESFVLEKVSSARGKLSRLKEQALIATLLLGSAILPGEQARAQSGGGAFRANYCDQRVAEKNGYKCYSFRYKDTGEIVRVFGTSQEVAELIVKPLNEGEIASLEQERYLQLESGLVDPKTVPVGMPLKVDREANNREYELVDEAKLRKADVKIVSK